MGTLASSQRILITGASSGIGRAAAISLASQGHRVVLAARTRSRLLEVATGIESAGGHAEVLPLDLCDETSVREAMLVLLDRGPCDVVVNNAGACRQGRFLDQDPSSLRDEMELNYWGAVRVTRGVLPAMLARERGLIVNVSSLLGSIGTPSTANYSASKAALQAWSQGLRGELAGTGVDVTAFVAPHTDTATGRQVVFEGVRSLPVDYTVRELLRAIDRRPWTYAASPVYRMLLRLNGWFPRFMAKQLARSARPALEAR